MRRGNEYPLTDGQGTTKLTTSASQAIVSTQETEAFGRTLGTTGFTGSPFGYHGGAGYRSDGDGPAGLEPYQKVGARYYDATFGRFITRDTDLSQAAYAYCDGDPVNFSDPTGHKGSWWQAIGKFFKSLFGGSSVSYTGSSTTITTTTTNYNNHDSWWNGRGGGQQLNVGVNKTTTTITKKGPTWKADL